MLNIGATGVPYAPKSFYLFILHNKHISAFVIIRIRKSLLESNNTIMTELFLTKKINWHTTRQAASLKLPVTYFITSTSVKVDHHMVVISHALLRFKVSTDSTDKDASYSHEDLSFIFNTCLWFQEKVALIKLILKGCKLHTKVEYLLQAYKFTTNNKIKTKNF